MRHQDERGFAILFSIVILSVIVITIGAVVLAITLELNRSSYRQAHQSAAETAAKSGLNAALEEIRQRRDADVTSPVGEVGIGVLNNDSSFSPSNQSLGNACYSYWFGQQNNTTGSIASTGTIWIHVSAASPYNAPTGSGDCDLRQVVDSGGTAVNNIQGTLIGLQAAVQVGSPNSGQPRVLWVRWSESFTRL